MRQADFGAVERVRSARPLIHCISNIVTAADCANLALAAGARPVMAQEPTEMEEIAAAAQCSVLNTGTPSDEKFEACRRAGLAALAAGRPVVLDPVGAGATAYRRQNLRRLLGQVHPTLIRANLAEVRALLSLQADEAGVDSLGGAPQQETLALAGALARRVGCLVLLSGETDCVTDGAEAFFVEGGSPLMGRITGAGCMLSVLAGAFLAGAPDPLAAGAAASAFWKACGEDAQEAAEAIGGGCGRFHTALFDAASLLSGPGLSRRARLRWASL